MERDNPSLADRSDRGAIEHVDTSPTGHNARLSRPNVPWDIDQVDSCHCYRGTPIGVDMIVCDVCGTAYTPDEWLRQLADAIVELALRRIADAIEEPGGPSAHAGGEA